MPHRAVVYVEDKPCPGIMHVSYHQFTTPDDRNYRPSDRARNGLITIRRKVDDSNQWFEWAIDSKEGNWKSGRIEFLDEDSKVIRKLDWDNGFVHTFMQGMPDNRTEKQANKFFEEVQIQAEVVTVDGNVHDDNWAESED